MTLAAPVAGVLLAGGRARRMGGGDKALLTLGGETLLARVVARARSQVRALALNANGDPARFAAYGLPVVADVVAGYAGPLAGVLTGLEWAAEHAPDCPWVASFATDAPFLPEDLVARLVAAVAVLRCRLSIFIFLPSSKQTMWLGVTDRLMGTAGLGVGAGSPGARTFPSAS